MSCCPRVLFKLLPPSKGAFRSTNTGKETPFESLEWLLIGQKIISNKRPGQTWELFQILIHLQPGEIRLMRFPGIVRNAQVRKEVVYAHVMKHKEKLYALHCFCTVARGIQAIQSSGILHLKELMQEYQT